MLHRLAPLTHFLWMFIEPALYRFYDMLILPARDLAVFASRAFAFNCAVPASIGPVAVKDQSVFFNLVEVGQPFAGRTNVSVLLGDIAKIVFGESSFCY